MTDEQCAARHPDGWLCLLLAGHTGDHLSLDNRVAWHGSPGAPVWWAAGAAVQAAPHSPPAAPQGAPPAQGNPTTPAAPPVPPAAPQAHPGTETYDACDVCGQLSVIRESACRTRCKSCGAIDGGCG